MSELSDLVQKYDNRVVYDDKLDNEIRMENLLLKQNLIKRVLLWFCIHFN